MYLICWSYCSVLILKVSLILHCTTCIATSPSFWESSFTLLNKLCYTYSYIYKITTLLILLVIGLIPTTNSLIATTPTHGIGIGIVSHSHSHSPNLLTKTVSFTTIFNFISITTNITFKFEPHHLPWLVLFDDAFNNIYFESLSDASVTLLFVNTWSAAFNANIIDLISLGIINVTTDNNCPDRTIVQPFINAIEFEAIRLLLKLMTPIS